MEYARNVLGISDADHEEYSPDAPNLVVSKLSCSVAGTSQSVEILPDTLAHKAYGTGSSIEVYRCHYGLSPVYLHDFFDGKMIVSGVDSDGEVRIIELVNHPFFIATLFVTQLRSKPDDPHPLIIEYLNTAYSME